MEWAGRVMEGARPAEAVSKCVYVERVGVARVKWAVLQRINIMHFILLMQRTNKISS